MSRADPRIALALCAHVVTAIMAIWLIAEAMLPIAFRLTFAVIVAAALLPGIDTLAMQRRQRFAALGLVLVAVIGAGVVEVVASGGEMRARIMLGAAMLEFALLLILRRGHAAQARSEREPP